MEEKEKIQTFIEVVLASNKDKAIGKYLRCKGRNLFLKNYALYHLSLTNSRDLI